MQQGQLYIIAAPSGAGKTSLIRAFLQAETGIALSISHTTRPKRPGEVDGVDYHFVTPDVFQAQVAAGDFLEHAQVFGNFYGTSQSAVTQQLATGQDVILEIDWQGAQQVRRLMPQCIGIFIVPPTRAALLTRLQQRNQDSAAVIEGRMQAARDEMMHYPEFDYLIVNEVFATALADLQAIVRGQRLTLMRQQGVLQALLNDLLAE